MQINLQSAADLCRLAVSHFRGQGGGRIVNVASRAAYRGDSPQSLALCRVEGRNDRDDQDDRSGYAADNILAFAVAPGFTVLGNDRGISPRAAAEPKSSPTSRSGRVTSTAEVAEAIRWLAVDAPAASTGSVIDLNGASYVR